jgi:hypothetical protein
MKTEPATKSDTRTPYEKFHSLAKRLMAVPKKEIDIKQAEYQRKRKTAKKRG